MTPADRKALTALYEACERRANEEGGDFGAAIGPAAELAEAALSASPSHGERRETVSDLLLPCPFCGQKAYIRKRHHSMPRDPTYQAYCDDCGCGTSDLYRQPALAIQAWNQRALAEIEPVLDKIAWLAAEEDLWFGNENDIAVQRAAAERHRAAGGGDREMTPLVKRVRAAVKEMRDEGMNGWPNNTVEEAADEIERLHARVADLTRENAEMKAALTVRVSAIRLRDLYRGGTDDA